MKNILNKKSLDSIITRVCSLSENDERLWGKMNAHQMLCHAADQVRLATGEIVSDFIGNKATTTILKSIILFGVPAPKGKVETTKELKQGASGTQPADFEADKNTLINLLNNFEVAYPGNEKIEHPAFGRMNKKEWSRLVYLHMDHHLKQFGR